MEKLNTYKIEWQVVAKGLGLTVEDTIEMFDDGRILGRYGEFLHKNSENGKREKENSSFDIKESNGVKTEIRTITKQVSFASSKEVGYGRKVTEDGFLKKLNKIDRFVLIDKREIEKGVLDTIEVTKDDILQLGLGKNKSITAKKFFKSYDGNK